MDGSETSHSSGLNDFLLRSSVSSGSRSMDVIVYLINDEIIQLTVDGLSVITAHELHKSIREALQLPETAQDVFALWLISPFLEVQLKPKHQPYKVCRQWHDLLARFTNCSSNDILQDEPFLQFRRNIFFPKARELQIAHERTLYLLYEEAKYNVLDGRYPCDVEDCELLGGLACRLELGPYNQNEHTPATIRPKLDSLFPPYLCKKRNGFFTTFKNKGGRQASFEQTVLNTYKEVKESSACTEEQAMKNHYREYLKKCHELPYYGCAFFHGVVDKPAQGFLNRSGRKPVSVAINLEGVSVIDRKEKHILISLTYPELSWDHTYPDEEEHILWLEFDGDAEGTPVNKLLKIYSKQAELMSGLIEYCIELSQTTESPASDFLPGNSQLSEKRSKLRRQESVLCNRMKHLNTIDYVEDGASIKRVKPKRTASFFTRQNTHYSAVQPSETPTET
ncbi:FERM domain-containing protein 8 isoform X1 [Xenopus tropicalis]|uniref:FERM domain-containing protein 8 n=2 Tax=Xenopus tropicalis TaxID=8364 RepID=FRMD8_XENTR|eukprot:XP_012816683.1 PREDICTED: FERM domain-containing protein 8 isoform X1 [Xenopus tropicalis]